MDQERIDVCIQELNVVDTYTSFNHNQHKSYIFTTSTTVIYIFVHVHNNFKLNCTTDNKQNACLL